MLALLEIEETGACCRNSPATSVVSSSVVCSQGAAGSLPLSWPKSNRLTVHKTESTSFLLVYFCHIYTVHISSPSEMFIFDWCFSSKTAAHCESCAIFQVLDWGLQHFFFTVSHFVNSVVRWGIFFDEPPQHSLLDIYNLSIRLHLLWSKANVQLFLLLFYCP